MIPDNSFQRKKMIVKILDYSSSESEEEDDDVNSLFSNLNFPPFDPKSYLGAMDIDLLPSGWASSVTHKPVVGLGSLPDHGLS